MSYHQSTAAVADSLYQPTPRQCGRVCPLPEGLPVYLVFQPMRLAIGPVTRYCRGLLPRVFTLTPLLAETRRYLFCGAVCDPKVTLRGPFPLGSMATRAARTFLPTSRSGDRIALAHFTFFEVQKYIFFFIRTRTRTILFLPQYLHS